MTNNIDRAAEVIRQVDGNHTLGAGALAEALADAGVLAPDKPEANDPNMFIPGGKGWLLDGPNGPTVWTAPGGVVMVQRIEPGELTPEQARVVASHFLAAADYAEGVGRADA